MDPSPICVLFVDDEPALLDITKIFLEKDGSFSVTPAESAEEAMRLLGDNSFDVIVSDYEMSPLNGLEFFDKLQDSGIRLPFIIFTGRGREEVAIEAINSGVDFYIQKGGDPRAQFAELAHKIRHAVKRARAEGTLYRTQHTVDNASEEVYWISPDGRLLDVNLRACRSLGYSRDELKGLMVWDIDPLYDQNEYRRLWDELLEKETVSIESQHRRADGSTYPVEIHVSHLRRGNEEYMCAFAHDISEKMLYEEQLRDSLEQMQCAMSKLEVTRDELLGKCEELEERERALRSAEMEKSIILNSVDESVTFQDRDLTILWANLKAGESAGISPEELIGRKCYEIWHGRDTPCEGCPMIVCLRTGSVHERVMTSPDGRIWQVKANPVFGEDGSIIGAVEVTLNITGRRQLENDLLIKDAAIESSLDAISILDMEGRMIYVNDAFLRMWGYEEKDELYGTLGMILREAMKNYPDELDKFRREGSYSGDVVAYRRDNSPFNVHISATMVRNDIGEPFCMIASLVDITDIQKYRSALEEANRKLNLLSDITRHDILNQTTAILGYLELYEGSTEEEQQRFLDAIKQLTTTICRQISCTRDYQDLGVKPPEWQNVRSVAMQAEDDVQLGAINVSITTGSLEIFADPLLYKVFANLFENAVRHGGTVGNIEVYAKVENGTCLLRIKDDGKGIPPDQKSRIFARGYGRNTGFGLFLVAEIMHITGMEIVERGTPGESACFEIRVPDGCWRYTGEK